MNGHQRPQNGSDAESFSFATFNQLWTKVSQIKSDTSLISWDLLVFYNIDVWGESKTPGSSVRIFLFFGSILCVLNIELQIWIMANPPPHKFFIMIKNTAVAERVKVVKVFFCLVGSLNHFLDLSVSQKLELIPNYSLEGNKKCFSLWLIVIACVGDIYVHIEMYYVVSWKAAEVFLCSALLNQPLVRVWTEWLLTLKKHSHASQEHNGQASQ